MLFRKKYITIFFFAFIQTQVIGQNNTKTIIAEVGKNGLVFNLLYDHLFDQKKWGFHAGGGTTLINTNFELRTATVGLFKLIGKKQNFLELGLDAQYHYAYEYADDVKGVTLVAPVFTYEGVYCFAVIGYRHFTERRLFRIGFSPGVVEKEFIPGAYIGYGFIIKSKKPK